MDVTGASTLTGNTNIAGSLTSSGVNTFYGATSIGGALTATSTLNVTGQTVFSSNVGIGTSSPYAKLSVVGEIVGSYFTATSTTATSTFANGIYITSGCFRGSDGNCITAGGGSGTVNTGLAGYLSYYPSGGTTVDDASNLYWDNTNSRLGIGTSSPYAKLSVVGETVSTYFTATSTTATTTLAGGLNVGSGRFVSDFSSGNTWIGSGNFGIGTTSPYAKLSVVGNTALDSSIINFASSSASTLTLNYLSSATSTIPRLANAWTIATSTTARPILLVNGNNGQVHIGNNPLESVMGTNYTLHVTQTPGAAAIASFQQEATGNGIISIYAFSGVAGLALNTFNNTAANGNNFYGKRAGGTHTIPSGVLTGYNLVKVTGLGYDSSGAYIEGNDVGLFMYAAQNFAAGAHGTYITFETTPNNSVTRAEAVRIDSTGNVGIASTSPWRTLGVNGTVAFNGLTTSVTGNAVCITTSKEITDAGAASCVPSALQFKKDISDITSDKAKDIILGIEPVQFTRKDNNQKRFGFIADWSEKLDKRLIEYKNGVGEIWSFDYMGYTSVITKFVQDLNADFQKLVAKVSGLEDKMNKQQVKIEELESRLELVERK